MVVVLCHVVGINKLIVGTLKKYCDRNNIGIIDLDKLHDFVNSHPILSSTMNRLSDAKKEGDVRSFDIERQIYEKLWNEQIRNKYLEIENQFAFNTPVVVIGLNVNLKLPHLSFPIDTDHKFFMNQDHDEYAADMMTFHNILYKKTTDAVKDHEYWVKQHLKYYDIYNKMDYRLRSFHSLFLFISSTLNDVQKGGENQFVWWASPIMYTNKIRWGVGSNTYLTQFITDDSEGIIAYDDDWIAIMKSIPRNKLHFDMGIYNEKREDNTTKNVKYVLERWDGAINEVKTNVWLYKIPKKYFIRADWHKWKINQDVNSVEIIDKMYISNIGKYLRSQRVRFIPFLGDIIVS